LTKLDCSFDIGRIGVHFDNPAILDVMGELSTRGRDENKVHINVRRGLYPGRKLESLGPVVLGDNSVEFRGPGLRRITIASSSTLFEGDDVEVWYEKGTPVTVILERVVEPLAYLMNLHQGIVFVHASAFEMAGKGVILFGWTGIGKTEILLRLMPERIAFLSDDWVGLTEGEMIAYPRSAKLSRYNIASHPPLAKVAIDVEGTRYLNLSSLGAEIRQSGRLDVTFTIHRTREGGLEVKETEDLVQMKRMLSTLSYSLTHYLGIPLAALQYGGILEVEEELSQYVFRRGTEILHPSLRGRPAYEVLCGYEEDEELVSELRRRIQEGKD